MLPLRLRGNLMTLLNRPSGQYYSCAWLEGGLAFVGSSLRACCTSHHGDRGLPILIEDFAGDLVLRDIQAARAELIRANQDPGHLPACRGCRFLSRRRWKPRQFSFDRLNLSHFTKCNLACEYCWTTQPGFKPLAKSLDLVPVLEDMIQSSLLAPGSIVGWGGGEPTILPGFSSIFGLLSKHGSMQNLNTNATILSATLLEWLPRSKCKVVISVDAGTRDTYLKIKGADFFNLVWKNAREYASVGKERVFAKFVLTDSNHEEVDEFLGCVVKAGIRMVIGDLDARCQTPISDAVINAAGRLSYGCRREGLWFGAMGAGANALSGNLWANHVLSSRQNASRNSPVSLRLRSGIGYLRQIRHAAASVIRTGYDPDTLWHNVRSLLHL